MNQEETAQDEISQPSSEKEEKTSAEELLLRLEQAEKVLIQERNFRAFEKALEKAGIRRDRFEAAWKLAGLEVYAQPVDDKTASELAENILANYPEFGQISKPLSTDQSALTERTSRFLAASDALELLRSMRK